jgi:hypothetical protein
MAATSIGSGAVSGEPLDAHFRKLGMNDTGFVISPAQGAQVLPFADQRLLRVHRQFERGVQPVPVLLAVEDLHWADPTTAPNYVADTIRGSFPRLTRSNVPKVVPFGRSQMSRSKAS